MMKLRDGDEGNAYISDCEEYRYWLSRTWDANKGYALFVMLNPSTATGEQDDATIRRCRSIAEREGCGGFYAVNLFAKRARHPKDFKKHPDPVGPENDDHILRFAQDATFIILAWGSHGSFKGRDQAVLSQLRGLERPLHVIQLTKSGKPHHPLYTKNRPLIEF